MGHCGIRMGGINNFDKHLNAKKKESEAAEQATVGAPG